MMSDIADPARGRRLARTAALLALGAATIYAVFFFLPFYQLKPGGPWVVFWTPTHGHLLVAELIQVWGYPVLLIVAAGFLLLRPGAREVVGGVLVGLALANSLVTVGFLMTVRPLLLRWAEGQTLELVASGILFLAGYLASSHRVPGLADRDNYWVRASSIVAVIAVLSLAGVELLPVHRTTYGIQGFVLGSRSLVGVVGAFMENFAHAAVVLFGIWMIVRLRPGVAAGLFISGGILRFVGLVWQGTLYSAHIETSSGYVVDLVSITAAFLAAAFAVRAREPYASGAPPTPPSAPDVFLGGHASEVTDPSLG